MYTGRLIENLLESVERAEQHSFKMEELVWRKSVEESGHSTHIYELAPVNAQPFTVA